MSRADCRQLFVFRLLCFCALLLPMRAAYAQAAQPVREVNAEARTARAFEEARKQGPVALRAFFYQMPKGADLHVHLTGAVYAESFIRAAGEDGLCVDTGKLAFAKPLDPATNGEPACKQGDVSASSAPQD